MTIATPCPEADELLAFLEDRLPAAAREALEAHLAECRHCRMAVLAAARLDSTTGAEGERDDLEAPAPRGLSLGRYVILDLIGQGAMGSVYAAFSPPCSAESSTARR